MKRFLSLFLVLIFCISFSSAEEKDPIIGAWYIMLDYEQGPSSPESSDKNYMIYVLFFDEDGTVNALSGEELKSTGFYCQGSPVGKWSNDKGSYTVSIMGFGTDNPTIENDRLLFKVIDSVYYSMHRLDMCDWYTDIVYRYN